MFAVWRRHKKWHETIDGLHYAGEAVSQHKMRLITCDCAGMFHARNRESRAAKLTSVPVLGILAVNGQGKFECRDSVEIYDPESPFLAGREQA